MVAVAPHGGADSPSTHGAKGRARYDEASLHRLEAGSSNDGSVRSRGGADGSVAPKQAWTRAPDKTMARYHATMHRSVAAAAASAALAASSPDRSHMGSRGGGYGSVHGEGSSHSGGGSRHGGGGGGEGGSRDGGTGGGSRLGAPWRFLSSGEHGHGDAVARTWSQWWHDLWLRLLIHPGSVRYQRWFYFSVAVSLLAGWLEPYHMAFGGHSRVKDAPLGFWAISEYVAVVVFTADLVAKFFVAFFDNETGMLVTSPARIAHSYVFSWKFAFDLVSAVPLDWIVLDPMVAAGASAQQVAAASFIKMIQMVRLYRLFEFFHLLDYSLALSQGALMVVRNTTYVFYVTHWAACMFYLIAQVENLSADSWVGRNVERFEGAPAVDQYLLALYFSVSAFTGLGDGSLYAGTVPEAAFMIVYLLFNLFLGAYILGTVTMLVVKGDERSKQFRDRMYTLADFSKTNELPQSLHSAMKEHLDVTFHAEHASDEQVLAIYPTTIRRKVLRHLYLQPVKGCYLFKGCKQRFLDAFLTAARVELFMPGVQILTPGDNVSELLLIVSGEVAVASHRLNTAAAYGAFAASAGGASVQEDASSHHTTTTHYAAATATAVHHLRKGHALLPRADASHRPFTAVGDSAHPTSSGGAHHHRVSIVQNGGGGGAGAGTDASSTHSGFGYGYGSTTSGAAHDVSTPGGYGGGVAGGGARRLMGSALFSFISSGLDAWAHRGHAHGGSISSAGGVGGEALVARPQASQQQPGGGLGGGRSLRFPPPAATATTNGGSLTAPGGVRAGSVIGGGAGGGSTAADASTHGSSVHSGVAAFDDGGNIQLRGAGYPMAEVPYFTDVPSHEGVTSTTVVRALSLPKAAWELLEEQFPAQARIVLENLQTRHEGEMYTALHNAALQSQLTAEQLGAAVALIKAKDGLDSVDPKLVAETRAALTQSQMDQLIRLDDVRGLVRAHVRKVDQMRTFRFLQQATGGDAEALRSMLNQGMSPNAADYDGRTGLMLAAAAGHEEVVRLLMDHGAKADQQDRFGNSAMFEAVKAGYDKVVDLLLGYGASIGMDGFAVAGTMCTAVFEGDLVKLQRLLKSGAPPDACDYDKRCALHIAGAEGNLAAVKLLVEEGGADPGFQDRWGNTALDEARRVGAAPVVAYLERLMAADGGAQADERWRGTAKRDFLSAAATGDMDRLARLLGGGAPPPCAHTALLTAASEGRADVIAALARWSGGGVIARAGGLALLEAADMGHVGAVRALRRVGAQLLPAAAAASVATASAETGAVTGVTQGQLQALLEGAVLRGDLRVVAALLEAGVRVAAATAAAATTAAGSSSSSSSAETVLHIAASSGNLELVRLLVEVGSAMPAAANADGATAAAVAEAAAVRHVRSRQHREVSEYLTWALELLQQQQQQPQRQATDADDSAGPGGSSNGAGEPRAALAAAAVQMAAAAAAKYGPLPDYASDDGELVARRKRNPRKARHAQKSKARSVAYVDSSCSSDSSEGAEPGAGGGGRGVSAGRRHGFGSRSGLGRVSSMRMLAQGPRDDVIALRANMPSGTGSAFSTPTATANGHVPLIATGAVSAPTAAGTLPTLPGGVGGGGGALSTAFAAGSCSTDPAAAAADALSGSAEGRGLFRVPSSDLMLLAVEPAAAGSASTAVHGGGVNGGSTQTNSGGGPSGSRLRSALKPHRGTRPDGEATPAAAAASFVGAAAATAGPVSVSRANSALSVGSAGGVHWQELMQEAGVEPAQGGAAAAVAPATRLIANAGNPACDRFSAPAVAALPSRTAAGASGRMGWRLSGEERPRSPSSRSTTLLPPPPPAVVAVAAPPAGGGMATDTAVAQQLGGVKPASLPADIIEGSLNQDAALLIEEAAAATVFASIAAAEGTAVAAVAAAAVAYDASRSDAAAAVVHEAGSQVRGRLVSEAGVMGSSVPPARLSQRLVAPTAAAGASASTTQPMALLPHSPVLQLGTPPVVSVAPRSSTLSSQQLQSPQFYSMPQALQQVPVVLATLARGGASNAPPHIVAWDRSLPSPRHSMRSSANGGTTSSPTVSAGGAAESAAAPPPHQQLSASPSLPLRATASGAGGAAAADTDGGSEALLAVSARNKSLTEEALKRLSPPTLASITAAIADDEEAFLGAIGSSSVPLGTSASSPQGAHTTARTGAQLPHT
ncbi:hypothetical protein HYH02_007827 [Chlamydomonas schloesseri]|uniref:Cyclic nucleotide-binding domain-containing protein n=1 Tax=Chlamydomonas schloesseri TaxID=2026947 RepID=A0A835WGM8_9CHLO|nr:hypothetical protein HYH02_007827 [Chlamydomonas schloesseri]|eukprot:KAG2447077.1 hypothetical protein HYH02_007827 [Chlamydomonas schloesseri]